jgi:hypothetical protein
METGYGHTVKSNDDYFVRLAERATTATVESGEQLLPLLVTLFMSSRTTGGYYHRLDSAAKASACMASRIRLEAESTRSAKAHNCVWSHVISSFHPDQFTTGDATRALRNGQKSDGETSHLLI